jgi:IclR family pca regulon transcriptional regulator
MGRVLLAGLSPEGLKRYFQEATLSALTRHTVTDRGRLARLIEECRRSGYAAVEDELAYGVIAVAVPVFDAAGRVVAALNNSGQSRKITKAQLVRERVPMLKETSRQISDELCRVPGLSLSAQT